MYDECECEFCECNNPWGQYSTVNNNMGFLPGGKIEDKLTLLDKLCDLLQFSHNYRDGFYKYVVNALRFVD